MNLLALNHLIDRTLKSTEEYDTLYQRDMHAFVNAVQQLEASGLSQHQLQLLIGCSFSSFNDKQCFAVRILALALARNVATVSQWLRLLQNEGLGMLL